MQNTGSDCCPHFISAVGIRGKIPAVTTSTEEDDERAQNCQSGAPQHDPQNAREKCHQYAARKSKIPDADQRDLGRPVPVEEILRFPRRANQWLNSARLTRMRGGSRSSRTLRWDAVDADALLTNGA
jgi:hypothetical protein